MQYFSDNISDIEFSNEDIIIKKKLFLTSSQVYDQVKHYYYSGERRNINKRVENFRLPSYASVFYKYIISNNAVPTEDQFIKNYIESYFERNEDIVTLKLEFGKESDFNFEDVKSRLLRAYPSLIRNFHFYLLCKESGFFEEVKYSLSIDCYGGVNIVVHRKGIEYSISLYANTLRASKYKNKKVDRHNNNYVNKIEVPIDLYKPSNKVGLFYLYNKDHVMAVVKTINQKEEQTVMN